MDPALTPSCDEQVQSIVNNLENVMGNVTRARRENARLEMARDSAEIYLASIRSDVAVLQELLKQAQKTIRHAVPEQVNPQDSPRNHMPTVTPAAPTQQMLQPRQILQPPVALPVTIPVTAAALGAVAGKSLAPALTKVDHVSYEVTPVEMSKAARLRYALKTDSVVCTVDFNHDGSWFAFANTGTIFMLNTADGSLIGTLEIPRAQWTKDFNVRDVKISRDSQFLAVTGPANQILMYSVKERKLIATLEAHTDDVSSLLFMSDSTTMLSGGFDGMLCLWDLNSMTLAKSVHRPCVEGRNQEEMIVALDVMEPDGVVVVAFMNGNVGMCDMKFQEPMNTFTAHEKWVFSIAVSPFDQYVATSSHDRKTKIWSLRCIASCRKTLSGHGDSVLTAAFSPKDTIVFTGSKDECIKAWNYSTGSPVLTIKGHKNTVFKISHHPSEKVFVSCSGDQHVSLWEYDI